MTSTQKVLIGVGLGILAALGVAAYIFSEAIGAWLGA